MLGTHAAAVEIHSHVQTQAKNDEIEDQDLDLEIIIGELACTSGQKGKYKTERIVDSFKTKDIQD